MFKHLLVLFAILLIAPANADASNCPVINGEYKRELEVKGKRYLVSITYFTRIDGDEFSYSTENEGAFQPADGIARPISIRDIPGMLTMYCEGKKLISLSQADGSEKISKVEISMLNEREMKAVFSQPQRSGIYIKE